MSQINRLTKLFNIQFSVLLTLFLAFSIVGCEGCDSPAPKGKKQKTRFNDLPDSKKVIVLFHGLNSDGDLGIKKLGEKLAKDIKNAEIIILDRENSGTISTTDQAEEEYAKLKKQMEDKGLVGHPVCLIGDSQGGLVALELYRMHKDDLNIKGIITNHSPLEGAPGAHASRTAVNDFEVAVKKLLPKLTGMLPEFKLDISQLNFSNFFEKEMDEVIKEDFKDNSSVLKNIQKTLQNADIPILILGGEIKTLSGIVELILFFLGDNLELSSEQINQIRIFAALSPAAAMGFQEELNDVEKKFNDIIGDESNDIFLPLYSQMGEHISKSSKVQEHHFYGYHHFYGMSEYQEAYKKITGFIDQAFENK